MTRAVSLAPGDAHAGVFATRVAQLTSDGPADLETALRAAADCGTNAPLPSLGTVERWEGLATAAAADVALARVLEPHLDALAILAEAGWQTHEVSPSADTVWGVYAAEGPGVRLRADLRAGTWRLTGTKPWCSLAQVLPRALVTAWIDDEHRGLFAVELEQTSVRPHDGPWHARGLQEVVSAAVDFDDAAAVPVDGPDWYLRRPGFAWGGMGVAAVWWGAVLPLADRVRARAAADPSDDIAAMHAGRVDALSWSARAVLAEAARLVDEEISGPEAVVLSARVRSCVAASVRQIMLTAELALGPGPLTTDERYARRLADLGLYLAQHHADRDEARLGRKLAP